MKRNAIDIFAKGNQELFHSAFLAWLMDDGAEHGLGDSFLTEVVSLVNKKRLEVNKKRLAAGEPELPAYEVPSACSLKTEHPVKEGRLDVAVLAEDPKGGILGLAFENKTKAFGGTPQLEKYERQGFHVAVLALLPETISREARDRYPVVTYHEVADLLAKYELSPVDHHHFLVAEYLAFVRAETGVFGALRSFVDGETTAGDLRRRWRELFEGRTYGDNDVRTLDYFYFYLLVENISSGAAELILGSAEYNDDRANTRWIAKKNVQGPPYLEALLYRTTSDSGRFRLNADFAPYMEPGGILAPRMEIWLNPETVTGDGDAVIGWLAVGAFGDTFRKDLDEHPRFRGRFKRRGQRHFHSEDLRLEDLRLDRMTERLRDILGLVGEFVPEG